MIFLGIYLEKHKFRLKAGGEGTTEDETVGWHHQRNGHVFESTLGVGDGRGYIQFMGSQRVGHD